MFSSPAVDGNGTIYLTVTTRTIPSTAQTVALSRTNGSVLWAFSVDTLGNAIRPFDPALDAMERFTLVNARKGASQKRHYIAQFCSLAFRARSSKRVNSFRKVSGMSPDRAVTLFGDDQLGFPGFLRSSSSSSA